MVRKRVSTTVDADLLERARKVHGGSTDASLLEAAFAALIKQSRDREIDQAYARGYAEHPVGEPDEWGSSLTEWSEAVHAADRR